jgi:hypothetical protein
MIERFSNVVTGASSPKILQSLMTHLLQDLPNTPSAIGTGDKPNVVNCGSLVKMQIVKPIVARVAYWHTIVFRSAHNPKK